MQIVTLGTVKAIKKRHTLREHTGLELSRPHAPRVLRADEQWLWIQWVEGVTLRDCDSPPALLAASMPMFAYTMGCIHDKGVLHGDISSSNFVVDARANTIHPIDFGLAVFDGFPATGRCCIRTAAPEILLNRRLYDSSSEQYAIGRLLIEALMHSSGATRLSLIASRFRPIPQTPPDGVNRNTWDALKRMSSESPSDRFKSMAEAARRLAP
jgi:serine/threonine protein kinase